MNTETHIPTGISMEDGTSLGFRQILASFASSELGQKLAGEIRYSRYKPDSIDNSQWERLLGADVNNLKHLSVTYGLTIAFLNHCNKTVAQDSEIQFSQEEQEVLLLLAVCHDWAEAVVGDTMFDLKTDHERDKEDSILTQMIMNLTNNHPDKKLLDQGKRVIAVIQNEVPKLGRAFNAIERLGYLRTGLRAWQLSLNLPGDSEDLALHLAWLTNNVLFNQTEALIAYSNTYPPVETYLKSHADIISNAFENIPDSSFDYYGEESEQQRAKFKNAKSAWEVYVQQLQ